MFFHVKVTLYRVKWSEKSIARIPEAKKRIPDHYFLTLKKLAKTFLVKILQTQKIRQKSNLNPIHMSDYISWSWEFDLPAKKDPIKKSLSLADMSLF